MVIITQWNANSVTAHKAELIKFINLQQRKPDVIIIQETFLKPKQVFTLDGYNVERNDREIGMKGGVATLLRKGIHYRKLETPASLESIATEITINKEKLTIINLYIPPTSRPDTAELRKLFTDYGQKVVLSGDMNAHNPLWGSDSRNNNGDIIEDLVTEYNWTVLNMGQPTYQKQAGGTSIIDISIASGAVASKCKLTTETQTLGSDHFPSNISYNERIKYDQQSKPKWIQNKADWIHFTEVCRTSITRDLITDDIEETNSNITIAILDAAKATIPRTAGNIINKKINLPYWNDACTEAVEAREEARKIANKSRRETDNIEFKRRKGIAQRIIKNASREYWQKFCTGLNEGSRLAPIWKMSRKINGIHDDGVAPALKYNNILADTTEEKVELLAQAFSDTSSSRNYTPSFLQHKNQVEAAFNI